MLIFAILLFDISFATPNTTDALAPQSRFKPSVIISRTEKGYKIVDDVLLLEGLPGEFRSDVETIYVNLLQEQAKKLGLSRAGLQTLVKSHLEKFRFSRTPELSSKKTTTKAHTYSVAPQKIKDRAFHEHTDSFLINEYYERYRQGYDAKSGGHPAHIDLQAVRAPPVSAASMSWRHEVLEDESGILWILKKRDKKSKFLLRERLAYLMSQGRWNCVETRFITHDELKSALPADSDSDYCLSRIVVPGNVSVGQLPHSNIPQASSAIFAANILMRKYDVHRDNIALIDRVPIAIDNEIGFDPNFGGFIDSKSDAILKKFIAIYVWHAVFVHLSRVDPDSKNVPNGELIDTIDIIRRLLIIDYNSEEKWLANYQDILKLMRSAIDRFGLGDGFMSAELLDVEQLRKSILDLKNIKTGRELAMQAGYEGEELEKVVRFISENRETLGRDINEVLKFIIGKDYGLGELDIKHKIEAEADWGREFLDTILLRAEEAKNRGEKIIIGFDTSWIPEAQLPYIQSLLSELSRSPHKRNLDNIVVIRRKGVELASAVRRDAEEKGIPLSNAVILGDYQVLGERAFDKLRPGTDPQKWAFFAEVKLPEDFPDYSYIRLLEMLTTATRMAFGEPAFSDNPYIHITQQGKRRFRFEIPKAEPLDPNILSEIYNNQIKAMASSA